MAALSGGEVIDRGFGSSGCKRRSQLEGGEQSNHLPTGGLDSIQPPQAPCKQPRDNHQLRRRQAFTDFDLNAPMPAPFSPGSCKPDRTGMVKSPNPKVNKIWSRTVGWKGENLWRRRDDELLRLLPVVGQDLHWRRRRDDRGHGREILHRPPRRSMLKTEGEIYMNFSLRRWSV